MYTSREEKQNHLPKCIRIHICEIDTNYNSNRRRKPIYEPLTSELCPKLKIQIIRQSICKYACAHASFFLSIYLCMFVCSIIHVFVIDKKKKKKKNIFFSRPVLLHEPISFHFYNIPILSLDKNLHRNDDGEGEEEEEGGKNMFGMSNF